MANLKEIYWLAGWLEGEGSFLAKKHWRGGGISLVIRGASTDLDMVQKVAAILGASVYKRGVRKDVRPSSHPEKWKQVWDAVLARSPESAAWMMTLYPLMGERRRSQIAKAIKQWKKSGKIERGITRDKRGRFIFVHRKRMLSVD